jgi:uncharacterized membrane protein YfcA
MPQSRKRPGHHEFKKPADIPADQRIRGRVFVAILMVVFGLLIAYFAVGNNYIVLAIVAIACAMLGYILGKKMEKDAGRKTE